MPTRASDPPRRIPHRDVAFLGTLAALPEHKISSILPLVGLIAGRPFPLAQRDRLELRQLTVGREAGDIEIDRALRLIGEATVHQLLYHLDHLRHVVGGAGIVLGPLDPQPIVVLEKALYVRLCQLPQPNTPRNGGVNRPIVDIGQVPHLDDAVALPLEVAAQDVLAQERAEVADVGVVVDRGAAGVHGDAAVLCGAEFLLASREGVVEG